MAVVAPGVLFNDFAIFVTPALAFAIIFICFTSALVHARRTAFLVFLAITAPIFRELSFITQLANHNGMFKLISKRQKAARRAMMSDRNTRITSAECPTYITTIGNRIAPPSCGASHSIAFNVSDARAKHAAESAVPCVAFPSFSGRNASPALASHPSQPWQGGHIDVDRTLRLRNHAKGSGVEGYVGQTNRRDLRRHP